VLEAIAVLPEAGVLDELVPPAVLLIEVPELHPAKAKQQIRNRTSFIVFSYDELSTS
jgi:hypothetical protein